MVRVVIESSTTSTRPFSARRCFSSCAWRKVVLPWLRPELKRSGTARIRTGEPSPMIVTPEKNSTRLSCFPIPLTIISLTPYE